GVPLLPGIGSRMQEKQYSPSLLSFFIYNPKFGPREGEEEKKILFYHPSEVEKNEKIRNVGLCEAIVQFTRYGWRTVGILCQQYNHIAFG
uniref:CCZ1/INTU/HSP4 first Longin domain-containing protein n=1 Tax=Paramormyrops kingsleyae TaxID=1676925 RepID=A0A3B3RH32_9TELE